MSQRTSLVIGGGSGIGAAIAHDLAAAGDRVVVADLNADAAAWVAAELGAGHASLGIDVTDEESVVAAFAHEATAGLGAVVNCAGSSTLAAIVDHDTAEWRRVVDICLTGAFLVIKHAGRALTPGGVVVSLTSLNARQPGAGLAAYCAAKAGLVSLTEVAALELAERGIRVNAVAPGLVVTPLTQPAMDIPGIREEYVANTPLGRSGEPSEIAEAVRYLLGAAWVTGETLQINGGAHLMRYPDLPGLIAEAFA